MKKIRPKGNLKNISIVKVLTFLNRSKKTGILTIKTPTFSKGVYLVGGEAVFASSTKEDDRLGEVLMKAGKISMKQYDASVELLKKTGKRQGSILVEMGYLTQKKLFWGVKYQVMEIIYSLFGIEDAEYVFKDKKIPIEESITLKMNMGNLIYEGIKKIDNLTRIKNEMPDLDMALSLQGKSVILHHDVKLSPRDRKLLSLVNGKRTIKELINHSGMSSFEALKILYAMLSLGIIEEKQEKGNR